jgi:tRNA 2-thiocytidine biosynthesis protein TtcA
MEDIVKKKNSKSLADFCKEIEVLLYLEEIEVDFKQKPEKPACFICSWERRKRLFQLANRLKCNKVALGHHKDDIIETLLLNIFYSGEISTMLPLQSLFKGKITIIRPLSLLEEKKIQRFAREIGLPYGPSGCPSSGKTKRKEVKEIIEALSRKNHRVKGNIFRSLSNIKLDYTLERVEKKSKRG